MGLVNELIHRQVGCRYPCGILVEDHEEVNTWVLN